MLLPHEFFGLMRVGSEAETKGLAKVVWSRHQEIYRAAYPCKPLGCSVLILVLPFKCFDM